MSKMFKEPEVEVANKYIEKKKKDSMNKEHIL